jgi:hypothetical protein
VWGKVGEFDPGSELGLGLGSGSGFDSGSEPGSAQIRVKVWTAEVLEHPERSVGQGQNSRVVQKNRKQAKRQSRRWRRLRTMPCFLLAKMTAEGLKGTHLRRVPSTSMLFGERDNGRDAGTGGSSCAGSSCDVSVMGLDSSWFSLSEGALVSEG